MSLVAIGGPAMAQVTADGTTVDLTPAQAVCSAQVCFEARNGGTINSDGNAVNVTVPDNPTPGVTNYYGAYAHDSGTINLLNGGTISVGVDSIGLASSGGTGASAITATGLRFTGAQNAGRTTQNFVQGLSSVVLNGTTHMQGPVSTAIHASGNGVVVTVNGPVQADLSGGAFAGVNSSGRIDLNGGGNVKTTGDALFGASNDFPPQGTSTITMTGMTANLTGNSSLSRLLHLQGQSEIVATNSSIQGTNTGGPLYGIDTVLPGTGKVTLDGSSLTLNSAGSAIRVRGHMTTVDLLNSAAITAFAGGANNSLAEITNLTGFGDLDGPGSLTLNATNSTLSGNVLVDAPGPEGANTFTANLGGTTQWNGNVTVDGAPSTADISLTGSAQWTGAATNATNINVGSGTTWMMTGDSSVTGTLTNGGTIAFQNTAPFKTLTAVDYVGNGGTLRINTALGDDSSPTDQLVINNGTATGTTSVAVNNRGGAGAVTNIGIPIIIAEGTTMMDSTAFSLSGPVVAGLYQYRLFQGTPDGTGTPDQEQSWYLRNTTPGPDPQPLTRPEAPIYGLMPGIARALNVDAVGTFHERNGDQQLLRDNGRGWGRLFGHHREQGFTGTLSERFKGNAGGLQAGIDFTRWQQPDGSEQRTGVFFAFAMAKGDAHGLALATPDRFVGDLRLSATSVGAYWTHIAPTGAYLDAVLMGSAYDGSGNSTNSIGITVDGWGATASLEAGLPIQLGGGFTIEPQAQIIWQSLSLDGKDAFTSVDYGVPSAWQGRLGVRLAGNFAPWGWTNARPYLKASFVADWADEHSTTFAGLQRIRTGQEVNMAEVGAGFTAQFTPSVGVWGTVDYSTDVNGGTESREIWRANAGVRVVW